MSFIHELNNLAEEALTFIKQKVIHEKRIQLFDKSENEETDWNKDIFNDIPEFLYYGKYGFTDWAAVKEVFYSGDGRIKIQAILKGESYPTVVIALLEELSPEYVINLATYLSKNNFF